MNTAEQNLLHISNRINDLLSKLQNINTNNIQNNDTVNANEISKLLSDLFDAKQHQEKILSDDFKSEIKALLKAHPKRTEFKDYRPTNVLYRNGNEIKIYSPYYVIKGQGNKKNKGLMPALNLLGIFKDCSGESCSYISKLCSALSSYEEVRKLLKSKGITISIKTIVAISKHMALRSRLALKAEEQLVNIGDGKRIVVSVDGGRVRIRKKKPGPKTAKKRNRYIGQWKEVKLFVIYLVDENGNKIAKELPIIDGLIGSADAAFHMLKNYLSQLNLRNYDHIVFIADGAPWIWHRAKNMVLSLGVDESKYTEILDYYHAMEHLNKLANALFSKSKDRKKWLSECKKLLLNDDHMKFINKLESDTKGKRGKKVKREKQYFINNQDRLGYQKASDNGLPLGSGSIESSIRRVVNLRLKGNSIFWKEESANDMIFLRSYYKAGRWNDLENMAYKGGLKLVA